MIAHWPPERAAQRAIGGGVLDLAKTISDQDALTGGIPFCEVYPHLDFSRTTEPEAAATQIAEQAVQAAAAALVKILNDWEVTL